MSYRHVYLLMVGLQLKVFIYAVHAVWSPTCCVNILLCILLSPYCKAHVLCFAPNRLYQAVLVLFNDAIRKRVQEGINSVLQNDVPNSLNQVSSASRKFRQGCIYGECTNFHHSVSCCAVIYAFV